MLFILVLLCFFLLYFFFKFFLVYYTRKLEDYIKLKYFQKYIIYYSAVLFVLLIYCVWFFLTATHAFYLHLICLNFAKFFYCFFVFVLPYLFFCYKIFIIIRKFFKKQTVYLDEILDIYLFAWFTYGFCIFLDEVLKNF